MHRDFFYQLQEDICKRLEQCDGQEKFIKDPWEREANSNIHAGGGLSRVLQNGAVFEKAGVNLSEVSGVLPKNMSKALTGRHEELEFKAIGVSLVIHPYSPIVPTTHANLRCIQAADLLWYGGGMDLTPYYIFPEDCTFFHQTLKTPCDKYQIGLYEKYKKECDEYFYLPHRQECRGIGGIFFDYLGRGESNPTQYFPLLEALGPALMDAYIPIVEQRKAAPFTSAQKRFQLIRRGRYAEFNLIYDRGTKFGLETGGRTESILMSLPPEVIWEYNYQPAPNSPEAKLISILQSPVDWIK